jgi:uncharacterized protein YidB (DUF937 family)
MHRGRGRRPRRNPRGDARVGLCHPRDTFAAQLRVSRKEEVTMSSPLGDLLGGALKNFASQVDTTALPNILSQALGNTKLGNLGGLLQQLQQSGLGPQVASWLGNGANMPVSADQLRAALGDEHVRQLATSFGIPVDQLLAQLSQHLPATVDHLSPNGTLAQQAGP